MELHDNVYKSVELTGTSKSSIEEAIQNAISRASENVRNFRWFEVVECRGAIEDGKVAQWQVTAKFAFTVED